MVSEASGMEERAALYPETDHRWTAGGAEQGIHPTMNLGAETRSSSFWQRQEDAGQKVSPKVNKSDALHHWIPLSMCM